MPDLNSGNLHIDVYLTNLLVSYQNEEYCADEVFPVIPVDKISDKYPIYNKDAFLRSSGTDAQGKPGSIRRPNGRSNEITFDLSNQSFFCEQLAMSYPLNDAEVQLSDAPLQPAIAATKALTEMIMLDNEIQVANKVGKRGNYNTGNKVQLVTNTTSWAAATGKPISVDIPNGKIAVIKGIVHAATDMILNYSSAVTLSQNAEYLDKIKYTSRDGLTAGGLAPVIEGLRVVEARTQKVTSALGVATVANGYVWVDDQATPQDTCLIYYKSPSAPGLYSVHLGLTFEAPDATLNTRGFVVKRWREEWRDADLIEVRTTRDWRFVATDGSSNGDNSNGYATGAYLISGTTL